MNSRTDEAAELLSRLVACPSANPPRGSAVGQECGEGALADLLGSIFRPWGAETRKVEIRPGRFNFIARFEGASPRRLMLEAHADTVPAEGMTIEPFRPVIRGGRLYGRGSCDNKASMAAMLLAIREVLESGGRPPAALFFVATAEEEIGGTGARRLVADGLRVDAAIVGEPTGLAIVHAHKGACRFRIVTRGRAAHSSDPSRGRSAIARMARAVQAIEGPLARRLRRRKHPLLGPPTVSVGVIRGGSQVNVVPDRCEIEVDRRTLPDEDREAVAGELRRTLDALKRADRGFTYDLEVIEWYPAMEEDRRGPLGRLVGAAAARILGRARFKAVPWSANSGIFRQAGIPCILFGPGSIRQAHTADEWVELDQVVRAARVYAEIIRAF